MPYGQDVATYEANLAYEIIVTLRRPDMGRGGFQLSARRVDGPRAVRWTAPAESAGDPHLRFGVAKGPLVGDHGRIGHRRTSGQGG